MYVDSCVSFARALVVVMRRAVVREVVARTRDTTTCGALTQKKRGLVLGPLTTMTMVQQRNVSDDIIIVGRSDADGNLFSLPKVDDDANDDDIVRWWWRRRRSFFQPLRLLLLETHHRGGRRRHDDHHCRGAMMASKFLSTKTSNEEDCEKKRDDHQRRRRVLCWSCGEPILKTTTNNNKTKTNDDDDDCNGGAAVVFFCETCDAVVHPSSISTLSHYALLDAPETFAVDAKAMETTMKELQKKLHPDTFAGRRKTREAAEDRAREKEYSEALSARVNEAYGKLRDPLSRAKYLFALKSGATSVDDEEEEKKEEDTWGDGEEDENGERKRETVSPELLFLVMDVREAIEDAGEDVEALMKLKEENEERVEEATTRVGEALDDETTFDKEKARKAIVELTYYERIRKEIIERL